MHTRESLSKRNDSSMLTATESYKEFIIELKRLRISNLVFRIVSFCFNQSIPPLNKRMYFRFTDAFLTFSTTKVAVFTASSLEKHSRLSVVQHQKLTVSNHSLKTQHFKNTFCTEHCIAKKITLNCRHDHCLPK